MLKRFCVWRVSFSPYGLLKALASVLVVYGGLALYFFLWTVKSLPALTLWCNSMDARMQAYVVPGHQATVGDYLLDFYISSFLPVIVLLLLIAVFLGMMAGRRGEIPSGRTVRKSFHGILIFAVLLAALLLGNSFLYWGVYSPINRSVMDFLKFLLLKPSQNHTPLLNDFSMPLSLTPYVTTLFVVSYQLAKRCMWHKRLKKATPVKTTTQKTQTITVALNNIS